MLNDRKVLIVAFFAIFGFYLILLPATFNNSDTAYYLGLVQRLEFDDNTPHFGYTLLATPFVHLLPLDPVIALNVMSALFGALTVVVTYLLAIHLLKSQRAAIIACLLMVSSYTFLQQSIFGEIYIVQTGILFSSLLLWLKKQTVWSAILYLLALLVSPMSGLFIVFYSLSRFEINRWIKFVSIVGVPYLIFLGFVYQDFLFGGRGLLVGVSHSDSTRFVKSLMKMVRDFHVALAFIPLGLMSLYKTKKAINYKLIGFAVFAYIPIIYLVEYASLVMLFPFICIFIAIGIERFQKMKWIAPMVILLVASSGILLVSLDIHNYDNLKTLCKQVRGEEPSFVIGNVHEAYLCHFYTDMQPYNSYGLINNIPFPEGDSSFSQQYLTESKISDLLLSGKTTYVLDEDSAVLVMNFGYELDSVKTGSDFPITFIPKNKYVRQKYNTYWKTTGKTDPEVI